MLTQKPMNEALTNFRKAVADSTDLQEKVKAGADLVALGKESGFEFTQEELAAGFVSLRFLNQLTDPLSTIPESGKGGDRMVRRSEPTLSEPRFSNNEPRLEIRES